MRSVSVKPVGCVEGYGRAEVKAISEGPKRKTKFEGVIAFLFSRKTILL